MRADPLMTAINFERRFHALFKHVINGPNKPLGEVVDHFVRVEFQNRGSAHYHIFLWIKDIPNVVNSENMQDIVDYIDKVVSVQIPPVDSEPELNSLVTKLQLHTHSKYCQPNERSRCRFKFPKRPCSATKVHTHIDFVRSRGQYYEVKRTLADSYINSYNPALLRHFRSNMDIQIVNNAESVAYYICSYICKSEPDDLKLALCNLIHGTFKEQPNLSKYQRLWKIGTTVFKHRRFSAQEAAFRLGNLKMIQISREVLYLDARPPTKRFKMLKPSAQLKDLDDNCTDIFRHNILDYYRSRPASIFNMSLYRFASWYKRSTPPTNSVRQNPRIFISRHNLWMAKPRQAAVVRYPRFSTNDEDYFTVCYFYSCHIIQK
jgi:hypothetical protein